MLNWNELKYVAVKTAKEEKTDWAAETKTLDQDMQVGETVGHGNYRSRGTKTERKKEERAALDKREKQPSAKPKEEDESGFMDYLPAMGYGAAGGAVAGIPVALLAHALTGDSKNKNLRSYLKASLLGALIGGGVGAAGGAGYKAIYS